MNRSQDRNSEDINQYRRKCNYKVSKFETKIVATNVPLPENFKMIVTFKAIAHPFCKNITAKFEESRMVENEKNMILSGPSLSSSCEISIELEENIDREFGYIQTSKILFYEREFEKALLCTDFHAELMHEQDEVLDCIGDNNPFYSKHSYHKVPAGNIPKHPIKINFSDSPSSETLKSKWGSLVKQERYQQFFVYLVMRSKQKNNKEEDWKYDVLYSFDWFIYLKLIRATDETNNVYEYNCGINKHDVFKELPKWINSMEYFICNDDQFDYCIDLEKEQGIFDIYTCPNSINKRDENQRKLDIIRKQVENIKENFENIKISISNVKKCFEENIDDEFENIKISISNVKKFCEENIDLKHEIKKINDYINEMDSIEDKASKCIESLLPEKELPCSDTFCDCIGSINSMENQKYENFEQKEFSKMKFREIVERRIIKRNSKERSKDDKSFPEKEVHDCNKSLSSDIES